MIPDAGAYLAKAKESLAASETDLADGRFNAATSRAYYAAFQASVAILIENGIAPHGDAWEHRFVISEVSGTLIRRRKLLPALLSGVLGLLLTRRLRADYRPAGIGARDARDSVAKPRQFVREVDSKVKG